MCGIAGVVTTKRLPIENAVARMRDALRHRGPDDSGIFLPSAGNGVSCALAHTRLSIVDLSAAGRQPMANENNSLYLVCNGEIYNYQKLRSELVSRGHLFRSSSDSEVILHLYEEEAEALVAQLRGMFSFVIWDSSNQTLCAACDRSGIKPFYYYWDNETFIFASEAKAILSSGLIAKKINTAALPLFLKFGSIPSPATMYESIFSLEAGRALSLAGGRLDKKRYWNLAERFSGSRPRIVSEAESLEKCRQALGEAVCSHLVADVPVGIFLSGGVDSSSLVSLAQGASEGGVITISAVFPGTEYDESSIAKIVAKRFHTAHKEIEISDEFLRASLSALFAAMDQPTIDGLNTYLVSWAAKQAGLKVCLSGLGGDELFGGYKTFWQVPRLYRYMRAAAVMAAPKALMRAIPGNTCSRLYDMLNNPSFANIYLNYRGIFSNREISALRGENFQEYDFTRHLDSDVSYIGDAQEKIGVLELSSYTRNQLLRDSDVFGMCQAVEIRVPLLDHELIEMTASLPPAYKYLHRPNKDFFIRAVGDLPPEVYRRPKKGFTLPFDTWMRGTLKSEVGDCLYHSRHLDQGFSRKVWDGFCRNKIHWSRAWSLFVLESFLGR